MSSREHKLKQIYELATGHPAIVGGEWKTLWVGDNPHFDCFYITTQPEVFSSAWTPASEEGLERVLSYLENFKLAESPPS